MLLRTRMHSSRMHTGRSLTVYCRLLLGGVLLGPGRFSLVRGGSPWSGGFSLVGGRSAWSGGSPWSRGVLPGPGGFFLVPGGFSLVRGGSPWSGGLSGPTGVLPGPGEGSPETPPPCEQNE